MRVVFLSRLFFAIIGVAVFAGLLWQYSAPAGFLELEYNFLKPTPYFSLLGPEERLSAAHQENSLAWQEMIFEPIYFNLRLPRVLKKAEIYIKYKAPVGRDLKIGILTNATGWPYDVKDFETILPTPDGWQIGIATFDLTSFERQRNQYRIILASSGLNESGQRIQLGGIRVIAKK